MIRYIELYMLPILTSVCMRSLCCTKCLYMKILFPIGKFSLLYRLCLNCLVSSRFYSALYKKLIDPKLLTTTHQAMLLSLIFKAILKDTEIVRIKVFVKRLLQVSLRIFFMHILIHITSWLYLCNRLLRVESCT